MTKRVAFPALRCAMGSWIYYVTTMSFADLAAWLEPTREIHNSARLADWIQRQLDTNHAKRIATYLTTQKERLFSALVVGLYGAEPEWSELRVRDPQDRIRSEDEDHLKRTLGILTFQGTERLFAIDGQHRVAGIRRAIEVDPELASEEIALLLVAHVDTAAGRKRTRRLFTTLNKRAKRVSTADIVALDEDNGFAVVARRLVDDFPLLTSRNLVAFEGTASIKSSDKTSLTSIIGLYELSTDLYPRRSETLPRYDEFLRSRPDEKAIEEVYSIASEYWTLLSRLSPEYKQVFATSTAAQPGSFRTPAKNHLLFRPAGQRAFAGALRVLLDRYPKRSMNAAVRRLLSVDLWLQNETWHHVLWDPFQQKMLSANRTLAESHLLVALGEKPRSSEALARYASLINQKGENGGAGSVARRGRRTTEAHARRL